MSGRPKVSVEERFREKVKRTDGCWLWTAWKNNKGYGIIRIDGKAQYAHRISYQLFKNIIPDGLCVLHHCDNPACVNPDHLFLGTRADNQEDMTNKGRNRKPFGEENGSAKLTKHDIPIIRELAKIGFTQRYLARQFHVCHKSIFNIINGLNWKHLLEPVADN